MTHLSPLLTSTLQLVPQSVLKDSTDVTGIVYGESILALSDYVEFIEGFRCAWESLASLVPCLPGYGRNTGLMDLLKKSDSESDKSSFEFQYRAENVGYESDLTCCLSFLKEV
jgi:hypothetical protein